MEIAPAGLTPEIGAEKCTAPLNKDFANFILFFMQQTNPPPTEQSQLLTAPQITKDLSPMEDTQADCETQKETDPGEMAVLLVMTTLQQNYTKQSPPPMEQVEKVSDATFMTKITPQVEPLKEASTLIQGNAGLQVKTEPPDEAVQAKTSSQAFAAYVKGGTQVEDATLATKETPAATTEKITEKTKDKLTEKAQGRIQTGEQDPESRKDPPDGDQFESLVKDTTMTVEKMTGKNPDKNQDKISEKIPDKISAAEIHRELPKILTQMVRSNPRTGSHDVTIRLEPAELGKMVVKVTAHDGAVSVKITADLPQTCALVENGLIHLRDSLQDQGIRCGRLDVALSGQSGQPGQSFQDFRQNNSNSFYERPFNHAFSRDDGHLLKTVAGNTGQAAAINASLGRVDYVV